MVELEVVWANKFLAVLILDFEDCFIYYPGGGGGGYCLCIVVFDGEIGSWHGSFLCTVQCVRIYLTHSPLMMPL